MVGCVRVPTESHVQTVEITDPRIARGLPVEHAAILSAHFALDAAAALQGQDALPVVFSVELDASTVVPEYFFVGRQGGARARPTAAILAPASEDDENRTVLLIGEFGSPTDRPPTSVAVAGPVYSEGGTSLRGLSASVLPYDTPPTVVLALRLSAAEGRCAGAGSVVRTYWTEGLRGLSPEAATQVSVQLADGATRPASAFDDQAPAGQDGADDNVLDVCVAEASAPLRLKIAANVVTDPAGHPNAAVDVDVPHDGG